MVEKAKAKGSGELAPTTRADIFATAFFSFYYMVLIAWIQGGLAEPLPLFEMLMAQHITGSAGPCTVNSDCHSGYCSQKYCAGTTGCKSDGDCASGWTCQTYTSLLNGIGNFFGGNSHSTVCVATCGNCPPDQHCSTGTSPGLCEDGSLLIVSVTAPSQANVNRPVPFAAMVQASADIVSYAWNVGTSNAPVGPSIMYTFTQPGLATVAVTVVDSTGNMASNQTSVNILAGAGGMCSEFVYCQSGLSCRNGTCM